MPETLEMDRLSFGEDAWGEEDYLRALRQRNTIGMVQEFGDRVIGVMIYELHKHHLELVRFVVHPNYRRRQVGAQLMRKLQSKLSSHRRTAIALEVPDHLLSAHLFFRSQGFVATKVLRGRAGEPDFYHMRYTLPIREGVEVC